MVRKRSLKRCMAVFLALCMMFAVAPLTAFADEGPATGPSGMPDSNIGTGGSSNGRVEVDTTYVSGVSADHRDKNPHMGTISFSMNESCFVWNSKTDGVQEDTQYYIHGDRVLGYAGAVKEVTFNDDGVVVIDVNYAEGSKRPGDLDAVIEFGLYTNDKLRGEARVDGTFGLLKDYRYDQRFGRVVYQVKKGETYYLGASVPLAERPSNTSDVDQDKPITLDISVRHYRNYGTDVNTLTDKSSLYVGAFGTQDDLYRLNPTSDGVVSLSLSNIDGYDKREESDYTVGELVYYGDPAVLDSGKNVLYAPDYSQMSGDDNFTFGVKGGQTYHFRLTNGSQDPAPYKITYNFTKSAAQAGADKDKALEMKKDTVYQGSVPVGAAYTGWYKINLALSADLTVSAKSDYGTGIGFKVYNSKGQEVQNVLNSSLASGQTPRLLPAGTYYVNVTKEAAKGSGGEYTLEWTYTVAQKAKHIVLFDPNGGTTPSASNMQVESGKAIGTLPTVSRSGYTFNGWYTAKTGGTRVTENTIITQDQILYAQWTKTAGAATPKTGSTVTSVEGKYKVTAASAKKKTVTFTGAKNKNAKSINVPSTVKIGNATYKVTAIKSNAFKGNKKVEKVTIGANITTISANAFSGCSKLKSVNIGKNVTSIGAKAFANCPKLTKVTIPAKVKKIGKQAFTGCKKLTTITIKSTKLTKKNVVAKAFSGISSKTKIKVPKSKVKAYKTLFRSKGLSKKVKVTK